jgi:hypothetical protein
MRARSGFDLTVDPSNPGEFLACCGVLEIADRLWGAEGCFTAREFHVETSGTLADVLSAVVANQPVEVLTLSNGLDVKPLLAPLRLSVGVGDNQTLTLDAWLRIVAVKGQIQAIGNGPWNFWSGQQTPLRIWTSLRATLAEQLKDVDSNVLETILSIKAPLTGRFGFDPGAAWNALDVGFSPNEQHMAVASSPAVELLAVIGLQRFRPAVSRDKSSFVYATWHAPLAPVVAAATAAGLNGLLEGSRWRGRVVSRGSYAALGYSIPKGPDNE